jgi:hypothetical protein
VPADSFATETMAELYAQQGHLDAAREIYEQLLARSPDDAELRRRAAEVERQLRGEPRAQTTDRAQPATGVVAEPLFSSSAADAAPPDATPDIAVPVAIGPTIREFFTEILNPRTGEMSADAAASPLTSAGAPAFESEGSLDVLFSDAPTDDADLSAAMSLAQAFGDEPESRDGAAFRGTPAHPAADELSLDHVFRSATPAKGSASAGAFSLDQFLAGELAGGEAPEGTAGGASNRPSDDIAQFNAWLNGLKKT